MSSKKHLTEPNTLQMMKYQNKKGSKVLFQCYLQEMMTQKTSKQNFQLKRVHFSQETNHKTDCLNFKNQENH